VVQLLQASREKGGSFQVVTHPSVTKIDKRRPRG
jgi:hypothetical protein